MKQYPGYVVAEPDPKIRESLRLALTTEASNFLTICEQLRFAYDSVEQLPDGEIKEDLTNKLIDAFYMGKKMNSRLQKYKRQNKDATGSRGSNLTRLQHTEKRKELRCAR